ncbi:tail fiber assembly protein [Herbaspirillum sp.]|uniref:tail fiber assembly protein n=1 Tax=Herbaspirillum sp. TaxID=1890675 RepID=UPI002585E11F|nr:tail fiber assembly protein [Herbaspirillum sp.]MCP3946313.1 hypothetical protein [Herbaspirillum sp.]
MGQMKDIRTDDDGRRHVEWVDVSTHDTSPEEAPSVAELAVKMRARRNKALAASDWTQLPDAPIPEARKELAAAYRRDLRDIPEQSGFPAVIAWPVAP